MESESICDKYEPNDVVRKKTDLEKFVELYRGFGIECKVNRVEGLEGFENSSSVENFIQTIVIESGERHDSIVSETTFSDKIRGNAYTKLVFSNEGKFIEQGIWE